MVTDRTEMDELVEERPVPGALVRHRGARMERHGVERSAPRLEVQHGALWIRATDAGPGILASHGATTVQVRDGAAVLEVSDFEALLVVVAGRAAVKGAAALPRSVTAGHAVTLTLDGGFGHPEAISAEELAADRFVVENLARDALASVGPSASSPPENPPQPVESAAMATEPTVPVPEESGSPEPQPPPGPEWRPEPEPAPARPTGRLPVLGEAASLGALAAAPEAQPGPDPEPEPDPAAPPDRPGAAGSFFDPAPIEVPDLAPSRPELDIPEPGRKGLAAVVIVLVILAAVVGAIVLTGDEGSPAPQDSAPLATDPVTSPAAAVPAEATIGDCRVAADGYLAEGTVSGGGPDTELYDIVVGLQDVAGEVYVQKTATVAAGVDPTTSVAWTAELALTDDQIRPESECLVVEVEARP